jgi:hypothetical protein
MLAKKILIIVSALCLAIPLSAGNDTERVLKSSVTPEKGTVGQQFSYTLSIAGRDLSGIKVVLPEHGEYYPEISSTENKHGREKTGETEDQKTVPLYIISNAAKEVSETEGLRQISVRIDLICYRTGMHLLPEISITDSDGVKLGYSIPAVTIEEINKEGQPEDIEPPVELSGNYTRIIILVIVLMATGIAGYFIYRYFRNRKKNIAVPEVKQTPFEFFMSEIERLKLGECINEGRINDYVFGISITFRRFLSMELGFDAAEMTTGEISAVIKKYLKHGSGYAGEVVSIMEAWDLSKFAEFTLSKELLLINFKSTISAAEKLHEIRRSSNG